MKFDSFEDALKFLVEDLASSDEQKKHDFLPRQSLDN